VQASRAHREREEQARLVEALRAERATLIGKLIEASRLHGSGEEGASADLDFDLASFIAELRSEVINRSAPASAEAPAPALAVVAAGRAGAPAAVGSAVATAAQRLLHEGRLHISEQQMMELSREAAFEGRTEETLFGFSLRELAAPEPTARARAAERLEALGNPAAAPALATALHTETDPAVQVKLLAAFSTFARGEGAGVVTPHLRSASPEVRIGALKALLQLDPPQAAPHLSAAMRDSDRAVRRRASLLALSLPAPNALALGEQAVADADADVRCLGALALGAAGGESARPLLLKALKDVDAKVRQAAAQSLSRLLGEDVSGVVALDDVQLRREVRRLSKLPARPVQPKASALRPPVPAPALPVLAAVRAAPPSPPRAPEALCAAVMSEIRCAIRGRTLAELAAASHHPPAIVEQACELLAARGQVVRRGQKFFAA
jgi:HEAT repeat protein